MKYVNKENHYEICPETIEEIYQLKEEYPHLWPFDRVCVAFTAKQMNTKQIWEELARKGKLS